MQSFSQMIDYLILCSPFYSVAKDLSIIFVNEHTNFRNGGYSSWLEYMYSG